MHQAPQSEREKDGGWHALRVPALGRFLPAAAAFLIAGSAIDGVGADSGNVLEAKPGPRGLLLSLSNPAAGHAVIERSTVLGTNQWRPYLNLGAGTTNAVLPLDYSASFFRVQERIPAPAFQFSSQTLCNWNGCVTYFAVSVDQASFAKFPPETWEFVLSNTNGLGQRPGFRVGEPANSSYLMNVTGSSREEVSGWVPQLIKRLQ